MLPYESQDAEERGIWEASAHDVDDTEMSTKRLIVLLNLVAGMRQWNEFSANLGRRQGVEFCDNTIVGVIMMTQNGVVLLSKVRFDFLHDGHVNTC